VTPRTADFLNILGVAPGPAAFIEVHYPKTAIFGSISSTMQKVARLSQSHDSDALDQSTRENFAEKPSK
jgi:hypothetical protein